MSQLGSRTDKYDPTGSGGRTAGATEEWPASGVWPRLVHARAPEGDGSSEPTSEEEQLQREICAALLAAPELDAASLSVGIDDGRVILGGNVNDLREKRLACEIVRRCAGAASIVCALTVRGH